MAFEHRIQISVQRHCLRIKAIQTKKTVKMSFQCVIFHLNFEIFQIFFIQMSKKNIQKRIQTLDIRITSKMI